MGIFAFMFGLQSEESYRQEMQDVEDMWEGRNGIVPGTDAKRGTRTEEDVRSHQQWVDNGGWLGFLAGNDMGATKGPDGKTTKPSPWWAVFG